MPPLDSEKIKKFLETWNTNLGKNPNDPIWIEIQGVTSLIKVSIADDQSVTFHPNEGYLLKAFLNRETGEVKTFSANLFAKK